MNAHKEQQRGEKISRQQRDLDKLEVLSIDTVHLTGFV